jgi:competence protein ComEA
MQDRKETPSLLVLLLALMLAPSAWTAEGEPDIDAEPRVNINQAGPQELAEALDGVGDAKAQSIIDYRNKNGGFDSPRELTSVNGIGSVTLKDNVDRIQVD